MVDCLGVIGGSCLCEQIVNWKSKQCFIMTMFCGRPCYFTVE